MAGRIRTIKPELLEDEKASAMSDSAWRLWVSLWLLVDDYGNARAGERYLAAQVWQDTTKDVFPSLFELIQNGVLLPYSFGGQHYVSVKNWSKHQRIDNAGQQRVPSPSEDDGQWRRELSEILAANSKTTPQLLKLTQNAPKVAALPPTTTTTTTTTTTGSADTAPSQVLLPEIPAADSGAPGLASPQPSVATRVFEHYVTCWRAAIGGKRAPVYTPKRGALVKNRLAEGFTEDDLLHACEGLFQSKFHLGDNNENKRWVEFDLVMRDAKHVEQFIAIREEAEARRTLEDPIAPAPKGSPEPPGVPPADLADLLAGLGEQTKNRFVPKPEEPAST